MRIVLDTNVLVSGLLSPLGPPWQIVQLVLVGRLTLLYDARIMYEYGNVLRRSRFGFEEGAVQELVDQIESDGESVVAQPLAIDMPDPDDAKFIEVAIAGAAERLVTGNLRHYPARARHGAKIVTPAQFIKDWRSPS